MNSPEVVKDYLKVLYAGAEREIFTVLFLNNRDRVIASENMFAGTVDTCQVVPRDILKRALHHNANALILGHNHPSLNPEPSDTDVRLTRKLDDTMGLCDIRILDHVIIGGLESVSLAERGLL